jgi:hypothetical protein
MDAAERVAKKMMQIVDVDPTLFDSFTKKQKTALLQLEKSIPTVRSEPGSAVPKAFVEYTRRYFFNTLEHYYVNEDEVIQLSYMELVTYGSAFYSAVVIYSNNSFFPDDKQAILQQIMDGVHETDLFSSHRCMVLDGCLLAIMSSLSQVQFRVYGYNLTWGSANNRSLTVQVEVHSHAPDSEYVELFGKRHKIFKMFLGGINGQEPITALMNYQDIFPNRQDVDDRPMTVYIQNHAIHRLKERLDVLEPIDRARVLMSSLVFRPDIRLGTDNQPLICCKWNDESVLGYFPFLVRGDKVIITTFLPLSFGATNEGRQLQERLNLQIEDIKHLGMDKLRFYIYTDFDEIPELKQILMETGIYRITYLIDREPEVTPEMIAARTQAVKKYLGFLEEKVEMEWLEEE